MGIKTQVRLFYEDESKLKLDKASAEAKKIRTKATADAKKITSKASADAKQATKKKQKKAKAALDEEKKKARKALKKAERKATEKREKEERRAKKALQKALDKQRREAQEAMKAQEVKQKEKRDRDELARKKKIAKALAKIKNSLKAPTNQVQFAGLSGRKGRGRTKRVLYDPSGPPKKAKAKAAKAFRPTADLRFAMANDRKMGAEEAKEKENQCNVIEFMKNVADPSKNKEEKYNKTKGLLVAHGMGSGKTLTSLWVAKEYVQKGRVDFVNILAPNVAVGEFIGSFERAGITPSIARKIRVLTHDEFSLNRRNRNFTNCLVIVDEAHIFTKTKYNSLVKYNVPYIMLLSGTPAPNTPDEIVPLINLLCTREKDRWTEAKWNSKTTKVGDKIRFLKDKVSMYNIGSEHNYMKNRGTLFEGANSFPGYKVTTRTAKLSQHQNGLYLDLLRRIKKESKDAAGKYPFKARERAIVDSKHGKKGKNDVTSKVARVAKDIVVEIKKTHKSKKGATGAKREHRGRLLLYASHKEVTKCLMKEIERLCEEKKIIPQVRLYNGDTKDGDRLAMKEAFNNGELDLLIISKAGSVGLDLQCTSKVFLYDMWWNIPQINQIVGRAIRFRSHRKPPCAHEHVDVYIYKSSFATKPPGKGGKGVQKVFDHQVLLDADKKWKLVARMIEKVMKPAAIKNVAMCKR